MNDFGAVKNSCGEPPLPGPKEKPSDIGQLADCCDMMVMAAVYSLFSFDSSATVAVSLQTLSLTMYGVPLALR